MESDTTPCLSPIPSYSPSFLTQNRAYDAVIVLKQKISSPRRHQQFMDALTDFGVFDRQKFCPDPLVTGDPGLTAIVGPKDACR
jgi:hypothetical protein